MADPKEKIIHNKLITDMANHFNSVKKLDELKQMFDGELPNSVLTKNNVMEIVNALKQSTKITIGDYTYLKERIHHLDPLFVKDYIEEAEKKIKSMREKTLAQAPSAPGSGDPTDNPDCSKYEITKGQQGFALILNIQTKNRPGSEKDAQNLKDLFQTKLGFHVLDFEKLSKNNVITHLKNAQTELKKDHGKGYYCFVCVVMSHGGMNGIETVDQEKITMDEITKHFDNDQLSDFVGKPKIFIVQTCRGGKTQSTANIPTDYHCYVDPCSVPRDADMLVAYATMAEHLAVRLHDKGSWFILKLVEVVGNCYKKYHFEEMLVIVRRLVATLRCDMYEDGKKITLCQMSCSLSTLTKTFYLPAVN